MIRRVRGGRVLVPLGCAAGSSWTQGSTEMICRQKLLLAGLDCCCPEIDPLLGSAIRNEVPSSVMKWPLCSENSPPSG